MRCYGGRNTYLSAEVIYDFPGSAINIFDVQMRNQDNVHERPRTTVFTRYLRCSMKFSSLGGTVLEAGDLFEIFDIYSTLPLISSRQ